jgi:hypothetical protein
LLNKSSQAYVVKEKRIMTKPANSTDKPSPSDTPTHRPNDNGGKAVKGSDDNYTNRKMERNDINKRHESEEQPVDPIKNPPKEKGMEKGKVQP